LANLWIGLFACVLRILEKAPTMDPTVRDARVRLKPAVRCLTSQQISLSTARYHPTDAHYAPQILAVWVTGCADLSNVSVSDQHNIRCTNDDPKICAIADQFTHLSTDPGDQKAIFKSITVVFSRYGDFTEGALIQADNMPNILVKIHSETFCHFQTKATQTQNTS